MDIQRIDDATYDLLCTILSVKTLQCKKERYRKGKEGKIDMCKAFDDWSKEEQMKGREIGEKNGEKKALQLIARLMQDNRLEEVQKITSNTALRKKLYLEYGL